MTATVEGIYEDGTVRLLKKPEGFENGRRVRVTLEEDLTRPEPRYLQRGEFKNSTGRMSTYEDFKIAEWRGFPDDDDV